MQKSPIKWRVGCCGWSKGRDAYYKNFHVVEIQKTFYDPPTPERAAAWAAHAPAGFEFVLKAPQLITHAPSSPTYRRLSYPIPPAEAASYGYFRPSRQVAKARQHIEALASLLNSQIIVYQCPASFKPTPENLKNLRQFFRKRSPVACALEVRGAAWRPEQIAELCNELSLIPVVDPLIQAPLIGKGIAYFRLHGIPLLNYSYSYQPRDIERLLDQLKALPVKTCYVMFNNFRMFQDAVAFKKIPRAPRSRRMDPSAF